MLPAGRAPVMDTGPHLLEMGGETLRYIWIDGKRETNRNSGGDAHISCNLSRFETADSNVARSPSLTAT